MKTENPKIIIRKAKKNEFTKIAEIYAEGFSIAPYKEKWTNKTALIRIKQYSEFCEVYSILSLKKVVGLVIVDVEKWYDGKWLRLWELVIKKEFRGRGIGKSVMNFIENKYKKRGIIRVVLETHNKSDAFYLYKKLNYKENGWVLVSKDLK